MCFMFIKIRVMGPDYGAIKRFCKKSPLYVKHVVSFGLWQTENARARQDDDNLFSVQILAELH